jgi:hypothetical protein
VAIEETKKQHLGASKDENTVYIWQDDKTSVKFLEHTVSPETDVAAEIDPAEVFQEVELQMIAEHQNEEGENRDGEEEEEDDDDRD